MTLEDFVRPLLLPNMSDAMATRISKILSILYGLIAYGMVYLMANLSHLVEVVLFLQCNAARIHQILILGITRHNWQQYN